MPLTGGLYACEDPAIWQQVFGIYPEVIKAKGGKQKKLPALDRWYQSELPAAVLSRPDKYLSHAELVKLMEWKLTRGKFRPRLQQMVQANPGETVEACTRRAFQLLPDVGAAITELSQLKAIGPATASAVLAAGSPDTAAFLADEAVLAIPGLPPVQYTLKYYLLYLDKVRSCVRRLKKAGGGGGGEWTPHRVELCLWTWAVAEKLCPALLVDIRPGAAGHVPDSSGEVVPPAKKRKAK
ncbi:uncharacterized protein [Ambystoma mexicanum]|uniref:uncharacterized protein n=1 Tax=Ambystoma mexicanum TaxID=8296 RepID=UPI0037E701BE